MKNKLSLIWENTTQTRRSWILFYCIVNVHKTAALHSIFLLDPLRIESDYHICKISKESKKDGGFVKKKATHAPKIAKDEEHAVGILARVEVDLHISIRDIATKKDNSRSSVQGILRNNELYSYKIHLNRGLLPENYERRLSTFCCSV